MELTNTATKLTNRFTSALVYATQLHASQVRKGSNVPYISHLLSVAALVLEDGGDEDEAIAALLHDAVEDQGGAKTLAAIHASFGETVALIVDGCSDCDVIPKPPWRDRKLQYLEKMHSASRAIQRVSMADKVHNARSILADWERQKDAVWSKFKGGKEGTLWFYQAFLQLHQGKADSYLATELERVVSQLLHVCKIDPVV